jgi:hypothetical protein
MAGDHGKEFNQALPIDALAHTGPLKVLIDFFNQEIVKTIVSLTWS